MKVGYIYAGSWEHAFPWVQDNFDRRVWCVSDDFVMRYPRAAQDRGITPVFFYLSASAREPADFTHQYGFRMRRVPVRYGAGNHDREMSFRLLGEITRERCDLLHIFNYYRHRRRPDMFDLMAFYFHRRGIPFVVHYQGGEFPRARRDSRWRQALMEPRRRLKRMAMNRARKIFSVNHYEIERLTNPRHPDYYGLPFSPELFLYLPNIVDQSVFHPMPKAGARQHLGLPANRRYVLYVGFFRPGKGIDHVINILPDLLKKHPDAHLLLAGSGKYEPVLRGLIDRLQLGSAVTITGSLSHEQLRYYYNAADVHVLPSHHEAFGTVLIEAMACNTPSIGTNVGGIPEVLSPGAGLLVPPADESALAEAVSCVLDGRFSIPADVRDQKLREFSFENAGRILHEEYSRILKA